MEKYKIGIVPMLGDEAVTRMVITSLEEPLMTDLLVPVLYAERNQVELLSNRQESDVRYAYVSQADDAHGECVSVVDTANRTTPGTAEDGTAMTVWTEDLKRGAIDALVYVGNTEVDAEKTKCMVCLSERNCMGLLRREHLSEDMEQMVSLLERDLDYTKPRIAMVADTDRQKTEWEAKAEEMGAFVYGPFLTGTFFEEEQYKDYDLMMALDAKSALREFREDAHYWSVCMVEDEQQHITMYPAWNDHLQEEESVAFNVTSLNHALYCATDILRNRKRFHEARKSPLEKLFVEKKDERRGNIE